MPRSALILVFLLVSGCGEFAYKRGANSSDLESAKNACNAKASATAPFEKCMADKGWTLKNLSKMSSPEDDPVVEATIIPSDRRIENGSTPTAAQQSGHDYVAASPAKRKPDMMDTFKISSWWILLKNSMSQPSSSPPRIIFFETRSFRSSQPGLNVRFFR